LWSQLIISSGLGLHIGTLVFRLIFLGQGPSYVVGCGGYAALQLLGLRLVVVGLGRVSQSV